MAADACPGCSTPLDPGDGIGLDGPDGERRIACYECLMKGSLGGWLNDDENASD